MATLIFVVHSAQGAVIEAWVHRYSSALTNHIDDARAVAVDAWGNVAVTGRSQNGTGQDTRVGMYTAKYAAANGALLWEKPDHSPEPQALTFDSRGNVVVTGSGFYTVKYAAADGALLWEKRYTGFSGGWAWSARAVAVDGNDNVVVTGDESNGTNDLFYTAKYAAADGGLLWEKRFTAPNERGKPSAIAIDHTGNVAVTGVFRTKNDDANDIFKETAHNYTVKYAGSDGALLWQQYYNRPLLGFGDWHGPAIAVDESGNVIIAETDYTLETGSDCHTAKYAASDGVVLWEKRYLGLDPTNSFDLARSVAVDNKGNVAVTGSSQDGGHTRYYTAKYAATDGALVWERRYGAADSISQGAAVAFDTSGNVVVTGASWRLADTGDPASGEYYTAKYAAGDGALLWEARFSVPASGFYSDPWSVGLALGPNGIVAISGSIHGNLGTSIATVVYQENLPPLSIGSTGVRLRFVGVSGTSYDVERASAVTGSWETIATLTAQPDGSTEYFDLAPRTGNAFYRTRARAGF